MKFINISKGNFAAFKTVGFLAITLFFTTVLSAQEVSLKVLKSDALFIGVENLVQVTVPGIPSENIYIGSDGVDIEKMENGMFKLGLRYPGKTTLTVHGEGFNYKNFDFEVKRIPDPLAALKMASGEMKMDGDMTVAEFRKAIGIGLNHPEFSGKLPFDISSCNMVYVPKVGEPIEVPLKNGEFSENAKKLIKAATPGDKYYFEQVSLSSPFGEPSRIINSLVFQIK